ncbi:MAG: hypothetical protein K1Y02_24995 [Candidatus Hydrogenedentes bacterium]|nr:hypothetical protein [Candidatus Hydrogenedentota bacterium]
MRNLLMAVSILALVVLMLGPTLYFLGKVDLETNKHILLAGTVLWFVVTPFWMKEKSGT